MVWVKPLRTDVGHKSGPLRRPKVYQRGKCPLLPKNFVLIREINLVYFFFSSHADFSIFPPAESVFRFLLLTTSHYEWRHVDCRLECGRSTRA
jgi:hypothetical protein